MIYKFLNDTRGKMGIHPGSSDSLANKFYLDPAELVEVEIPEGTTPFIKVWDKLVLLSWTEPKTEKK